MNQLLKTRYGTNNNYQASLESIQKRIDEWQLLIVAHEEISMGKEADNRFVFDINDLESDYLFLLRCSFIATKGNCSDVVILNTNQVQSDDLNFNLDDPDLVSNFEWREINYRLASDKLIAYTDSTFTINKADLDYLRYPKIIDIAGYTRFDGTASSDINCELPEFLHEEIVNQSISIFKLRVNSPDVQNAIAANRMEE